MHEMGTGSAAAAREARVVVVRLVVQEPFSRPTLVSSGTQSACTGVLGRSSS